MTTHSLALAIYRAAPTTAEADRVCRHVVRTAAFDASGATIPWPDEPAPEEDKPREDGER